VPGRPGGTTDVITLGVEEEFLVVDAATGALVSRSDVLLPAARSVLGEAVAEELSLCQIEVATPVCTTLAEVRHHVAALRRGLLDAGATVGTGIAAAGTHPTGSWRAQQVNAGVERYRRMEDVYQAVARQQVICGCHVHIGIPDPEVAVSVMMALSTNSPFWQGLDTGYASYRVQVWHRWPTSGMPPQLASRQAFDDLVGDLVSIGAIEDATFLYWFVRPSVRFPTLEFRTSDVCLSVDETVAIAGLVRALAWTEAKAAVAGSPVTSPRHEVSDAAMWRATRYGVDELLVSPVSWRPRPAADVVGELLDHVGEGLEANGDGAEVGELVAGILGSGTGARRQRAAFAERSDPEDVVARVLAETDPGPVPALAP
jgi:carboxylate-amine ligase